MNNKTSYTLVGLFVILGFGFISLFVYWLVRPSDEVEMKKYAIYFDESVLGLNLDAPVKYRGIDVGKVVKLGINPANDEQVRVVVSIKKETPVKTTTVAKLMAQGITGLSYINLSKGEKNSPMLEKIPPGEKYPVIKTLPSFFKSVETSVGDLYGRLSETLKSIDSTFNEKNQKEFYRLMHESADFFAKLNKTLDDKTIASIQSSVKHLENITHDIRHDTVPRVNVLVDKTIAWEHNSTAALERIVQSYKKFEKMSDSVENAVLSGAFDIRGITSEFMPSLNKSLNSLNALLAELQSAIKEYKRSPRDMFFKEAQEKKAPGER